MDLEEAQRRGAKRHAGVSLVCGEWGVNKACSCCRFVLDRTNTGIVEAAARSQEVRKEIVRIRVRARLPIARLSCERSHGNCDFFFPLFLFKIKHFLSEIKMSVSVLKMLLGFRVNVAGFCELITLKVI